jgi:hypothetical protein
MNRTAGSIEIGAVAFLRDCGRRVAARTVSAGRRNTEIHCKMRSATGRCIGLALMLLLANERLRAEPAHFWISASNIAPAGPEAPTIPTVNGGVRFLHIWAQPATVGAGAWNAVTNPFKQLENLSLNLVTSDPLVEFLNDSFVVYNPAVGASSRFEFVHDSSDGLTSSASLPDQIQGLQGFSVSSTVEFAGLGPTCSVGDPHCGLTPGGAPAWLVASVKSRTIASAGSVEFRLQIGANGMNHAGENSAQTSVVFGFDPAGPEPSYNAGLQSNRGVNLAGDDADFVIEAFPPPPGDYNRDGFVNSADYVVWRRTLGQVGSGLVADGSGPAGVPDGIVNSHDFDFWRSHFGESAFGAAVRADLAVSIPEPFTAALILIGCALTLTARSLRVHQPQANQPVGPLHV